MREPRADQWDQIYSRDGRVFLEPTRVIMELVPELQAHGFQRVLDLGCGTGRHLVYLSGQGFETFGLDISLAGLQQTRQWLGSERLNGALLLADTRVLLPGSESRTPGRNGKGPGRLNTLTSAAKS